MDSNLPSEFLHKKVAIKYKDKPVTATIKWRGRLTVKNPDTWLGIEFDDEYTGTHNGTFRDKRIFHTFYRSESGSFMKQAKFDELEAAETTGIFEPLKENYPDFFTDGAREYKMDEFEFGGGKKLEAVGIGYRVKRLH